VERDGKSLLKWIRIHFLRSLPDLAGPELRFSRTPTASVLRNDACLRLPARNRFTAKDKQLLEEDKPLLFNGRVLSTDGNILQLRQKNQGQKLEIVTDVQSYVC
jgi:hypothetical protein